MKPKNHIVKLFEKTKMRIAGLMSGTSADGVDVAIIDIASGKVSILAFDTFRYPAALRRRIFELCQQKSACLEDVCHLNFVVGEVFAEGFLKLCRNRKINPATVDLIGSHGQTVYHNPKGKRFGKRIVRSTLQIGEPSVIAQRTGITTVADFRPRDMAANGQGAPLVPYADYFLFRDKRHNRAIQNIGGIANVTFLPAGCRPDEIIAFDTGPGNMLMDRFISLATSDKQNFDRNGKLASQGKINKVMLNNLLRHPFLNRRPPKSTGREEFGSQYCDAVYHKAVNKSIPAKDMMATVTAFTAVSIARAYQQFLPQMPDEVILCGGGAHNKTLVRMLQQNLSETRVLLTDEFGISCDSREAVSFAILAHATIKGLPGNIPAATGADQPLILGKIIPA
jgi:anhydro-N-acetylmuramic acid kinase